MVPLYTEVNSLVLVEILDSVAISTNNISQSYISTLRNYAKTNKYKKQIALVLCIEVPKYPDIMCPTSEWAFPGGTMTNILNQTNTKQYPRV